MRRVTIALVLPVAALVATACGSSANVTYDAGHTQSAMKDAGWTTRVTAGMPQTYTGAKQVAFLDTTAPDGALIDLQFMDTPAHATAEYTVAHQHNYNGAAYGNVLVIAHTIGQSVTSGDLDSVQGLLKT
ncbi:MAG: hypothetical protein ACREN2_09760 [Candidatus Dormibacteria bacterium]